MVTLVRPIATAILISLVAASLAFAQDRDPSSPAIRAGALTGLVVVDGVLDEPDWSGAGVGDGFRQTDPREGTPASAATRVRVLAGPRALAIGVECDDPQPG